MQQEQKYRVKTLNEIKEIDYCKIKEESLNMIDERNLSNNELNLSNNELQDKYNYLFNKLPSLFQLIIRDLNDSKNKKERIGIDGKKRPFIFNKSDFTKNLDILLNQISNIQNNKIKNDDENTHKEVCDQFTSKFIPKKFLK